MEYLELPLLLVLAAVATYVLAILLRVACYYCDVEIPALGRAIGIVILTAVLSLFLGVLVQTLFVGFTPRRINPFAQFVALVLALVLHMFVTTGVYGRGLRVAWSKAFSIWLVQAGIFAGLALVFGCCLGLPLLF